MNHASLFSGIGGFDLAARWHGWKNVLQCELDPFCQRVLRKHFPESHLHGDIKTLTGGGWRGKVDIISGGFPCQPFSLAGERRGENDDRFLWPQMLRVISEIAPTWVVAENVPGILSINNGLVLEQVYTDLETAGYETAPPLQIPACAVQADHRRDRIWIVAHAKRSDAKRTSQFDEGEGEEEGIQKRNEVSESSEPNHLRSGSDNRSKRTQGGIFQEISRLQRLSWREDGRVYAEFRGRRYLSTPVLCRNYDGIPYGMDRVKSCGNAIVPQVAYQIFKSIKQAS